ncbi:hypothetical protein M8C21_020335, partial [Ambrosia artemisiifolia]
LKTPNISISLFLLLCFDHQLPAASPPNNGGGVDGFWAPTENHRKQTAFLLLRSLDECKIIMMKDVATGHQQPAGQRLGPTTYRYLPVSLSGRAFLSFLRVCLLLSADEVHVACFCINSQSFSSDLASGSYSGETRIAAYVGACRLLSLGFSLLAVVHSLH